MPAIVLALLLMAAACQASATSPPMPSSTPSPAATETPVPSPVPVATDVPLSTPTPADGYPAAAGETAPALRVALFQGEDVLGGESVDITDLTGKPLVLNFWARFCTPCWTEMPELQDFYEERGHEVRLLGVDIGQFTGLGSPKDASRLLDSLGITYPAGSTEDAAVVRKFGVEAMPTTVFIDADGTIFRKWTGSIERQQVDAIVNDMLRANR